jgi:DNA-binding GntR family transcriptional regulator
VNVLRRHDLRKDIRKFTELNWRFHALLLSLARNPLGNASASRESRRAGQM